MPSRLRAARWRMTSLMWKKMCIRDRGGAYRPGCTVRWSSGSLGENGNFYSTLGQAGEEQENDGPFRVLHIG